MILYKYYPSTEYSFKSLAVKGLWCHSPKNMNDPFECLWLAERKYDILELKKFRQRIKKSNNPKWIKYFTLDDDKLSLLLNDFRKVLIERFSFCSLSEVYNNILMWSHYASSHTGFVIGIDFPNLENFNKVRYLSKLPRFNLKHLTDGLLDKVEQPDKIIKDLSIKSIEWKYEKEWRIWGSKPGYHKYKPNQIKEIYFGINCSPETKLIVSKLATSDDPKFLFREMEFRDNPVRLEF